MEKLSKLKANASRRLKIAGLFAGIGGLEHGLHARHKSAKCTVAVPATDTRRLRFRVQYVRHCIYALSELSLSVCLVQILVEVVRDLIAYLRVSVPIDVASKRLLELSEQLEHRVLRRAVPRLRNSNNLPLIALALDVDPKMIVFGERAGAPRQCPSAKEFVFAPPLRIEVPENESDKVAQTERSESRYATAVARNREVGRGMVFLGGCTIEIEPDRCLKTDSFDERRRVERIHVICEAELFQFGRVDRQRTRVEALACFDRSRAVELEGQLQERVIG
jgi:hypothetical protein